MLIDYSVDIWAVQSDKKLNEIQRKIDRFLFEFQYPCLYRRKGTKRRSCSEDFVKIREGFGFRSLRQRKDLILLKYAFDCYKEGSLDKSQRQAVRSPLVILPKFHSQTFKRSLKYRSIKLWNDATEDICIEEFDKLNKAKFISMMEKYVRTLN